MITKTYKYRLFPNRTQARWLGTVLETNRRLYNEALEQREFVWETVTRHPGMAADPKQTRMTAYDQSRWLTKEKSNNPFYKDIPASSGVQTLAQLQKAFDKFFVDLKKNVKTGKPKFKGRDFFKSFKLQDQGIHKHIDRDKGRISIPKLGPVRVKLHRPIPEGAKIGSIITFQRELGKWYVCLSLQIPVDSNPSIASGSVGIDVGLKTFVTTSDGDKLGDSRTYERHLKELRRIQRALARCQRGSNRRKLVKKRVAVLHQKVRNSRRDTHHKVSRQLANMYKNVSMEDLNIKGMLKNRKLSRRISDAAWYAFRMTLKYKLEHSGGTLTVVDPKYTSQECSNCGTIVKKSLAVRVHQCECGCVMDRDHNASVNILNKSRGSKSRKPSTKSTSSSTSKRRKSKTTPS